MKPLDDPWLKNAYNNAEFLDREIENLVLLTIPIRENYPIITKYQDFWIRAKHIGGLFRELKPLARSDRDLLWNQFNDLCREVRKKQKSEYGTLESRSKKHFDEIMRLAGMAQLPEDTPPPSIHELAERGEVLSQAGDLLAKFKHEMIAKHKKSSFARIQEIRKMHDAAWGPAKAEKPRKQMETESRIRQNLRENYERRQKAKNALENFQIGRGHIYTFLASGKEPEKIAEAEARLRETETRIKDIEKGIRKLETWIAEDEQTLKGK